MKIEHVNTSYFINDLQFERFLFSSVYQGVKSSELSVNGRLLDFSSNFHETNENLPVREIVQLPMASEISQDTVRVCNSFLNSGC